jgi:hypothetical protein
MHERGARPQRNATGHVRRVVAGRRSRDAVQEFLSRGEPRVSVADDVRGGIDDVPQPLRQPVTERERRSARAMVLALVLAGVGAFACAKRSEHVVTDGSAQARPSDSAAVPSSAQAVAAPMAAPSASGLPPTPDASMRLEGTVGFVLQHVEARCIVGTGANGRGHFAVGTDLIVETRAPGDDDPKTKPARDLVFCSKSLADGGIQKAPPPLGTWRNCRQDPTCTESAATKTDRHLEIRCGKDTVVLEVTDDGRTILRGRFGERLLAPHPMKIVPTKKENRDAMVDC